MKSENSVVLQALLIMAYGLLYLSHQEVFGQITLKRSDK